MGLAEAAGIANRIADGLEQPVAGTVVRRVRQAAEAPGRELPIRSWLNWAFDPKRALAVHCPFCNHDDTRVIDSRLAGEGRQVRRRRECLKCAERFTTFETPELVLPAITKRDKRREPFDEQKLRDGMLAALSKRPVPAEAIEAAIERILHRLQTLGEREIDSSFVGDLVMEELHALDEVAYVRFASIYRSFQDITAFQDEINRLRTRPSRRSRRAQMSLLPDDEAGDT